MIHIGIVLDIQCLLCAKENKMAKSKGIKQLRDENTAYRNALKEISVWNETDDNDLKVCRMQWRGCVAIATEILARNNFNGEK
jgi:hypothetical protein